MPHRWGFHLLVRCLEAKRLMGGSLGVTPLLRPIWLYAVFYLNQKWGYLGDVTLVAVCSLCLNRSALFELLWSVAVAV